MSSKAEDLAEPPKPPEPLKPPKRLRGRRWRIAIIVLVALLILDQGLRLWVQSSIREGIAGFCGGSREATASIESIPFIPRLVVGGISRISLRVEGVQGSGFTFKSFEVDLRGVSVNRSDLLTGKLKLRSVSSGRIALASDGKGPLGASNIDVIFKGDLANATVHGGPLELRFEGTYELSEGELVFLVETVMGRKVPPTKLVLALPEEGDECIDTKSG